MRIATIDLKYPLRKKFPVCACIGYFDGMHLGHQALIARTVQLAEKYHCESAMITFEPDPWVTIKGIDPSTVEHITTARQRTNLAVKYGIQNVFTLNFTKEMANLSPEDFLTKVLGQLDLKALVCGFDFHYAKNGEGNAEQLQKECSFEVDVVDAVCDEKGKISSTRITELLKSGDMTEATSLLGHPFEIEGKVITGRHKGTSMGFPTANVSFSQEYLKPKPGVYACWAIVHGKKYRAMVNFGHNPTMNYTQKLSLEAHLLDFKENIYGCAITLQFVRWIRAEIHFQSKENLIMQLEQDVRTVRKML